jgi:hypothetical protein
MKSATVEEGEESASIVEKSIETKNAKTVDSLTKIEAKTYYAATVVLDATSATIST